MNYRVHPGIVFQRICGRSFLIAVRSARKECPHLLELNEYGAFCWRLLEQGRQVEEIISEIKKAYLVDEEEAREGLTQFIKQLADFHYLLSDD